MMTGVMCTCAPSFAKTLQEHLPAYEILKWRLQSSFRSTGQILSKGSTKSSQSGSERRDSDQNSGDYISYKDRFTGGKIAGDRRYELHDGNSLQTSVRGGPGGFAKEDGVQLKSDVLREHAAGNWLHQGEKRK